MNEAEIASRRASRLGAVQALYQMEMSGASTADVAILLVDARNGVRTDGASIYVTASPCFACFKLIANAGIVRIVFCCFAPDAAAHHRAAFVDFGLA